MRTLIFRYAEGLQWVMHYYYSGVASWSWFYNYHYAPRISGIPLIDFRQYDNSFVPKDLLGLEDMAFEFDLGKPFHPFEQLMGVLPSASKDLIPLAYQVMCVSPAVVTILTIVSQDLMSDPNSPILDFYPLEFDQDLNGKKQEWEAIVKIPFIDENRLLKAMACACFFLFT